MEPLQWHSDCLLLQFSIPTALLLVGVRWEWSKTWSGLPSLLAFWVKGLWARHDPQPPSFLMYL
jgi:hypothetical protein